jgi:hypothetical protein
MIQTKDQSELSSFGLLPGSDFDTSPSSDLVLLLELYLEPYDLHPHNHRYYLIGCKPCP